MAAEEKAGHSFFSSVLTFAEVHHVLASKPKDKSLSPVAFAQAKQNFAMDWENQLAVIELVANILSFPGIFERTVLTSSDAVPLPQVAADPTWRPSQSSDAPAPLAVCFDRLGNCGAHALAQFRDVFFGHAAGFDSLMQMDRYCCGPEHPAAGAVMLE